MPNFIDITGQRFGRLTVTRRGPNSNGGHPRWECLCDCGGTTLAASYNLNKGRTQSCGCLQRERAGAAARISSRKHGLNHTPAHRSWSSMLSRCFNANATDYEKYGGRGIIVCERWEKFANFIADMGPRPTINHTLDRIDVNGHYEPSNCRWATKLEQANNRRDNQTVLIDGTQMTLRTACRQAGSVISFDQAWKRVKRGWDHKKAVSTPPTR